MAATIDDYAAATTPRLVLQTDDHEPHAFEHGGHPHASEREVEEGAAMAAAIDGFVAGMESREEQVAAAAQAEASGRDAAAGGEVDEAAGGGEGRGAATDAHLSHAPQSREEEEREQRQPQPGVGLEAQAAEEEREGLRQQAPGGGADAGQRPAVSGLPTLEGEDSGFVKEDGDVGAGDEDEDEVEQVRGLS